MACRSREAARVRREKTVKRCGGKLPTLGTSCGSLVEGGAQGGHDPSISRLPGLSGRRSGGQLSTPLLRSGMDVDYRLPAPAIPAPMLTQGRCPNPLFQPCFPPRSSSPALPGEGRTGRSTPRPSWARLCQLAPPLLASPALRSAH